MIRVFVDDLTEGMVLADDLKTSKGRFILAQGATLEAKHLRILKTWGVTEAYIVDSTRGESVATSQELDPATLKMAENYLEARFSLNDPQHEMIRELQRLTKVRTALQLENGWEIPQLEIPEEIPDSDTNRTPAIQMIRGEDQLASLPNVYTRIVETLNSPRSSASLIASIVSKDTSLSLRLLKLVNSAFYGFPSKIDSVSRAITLLGTNELTTLALGISVVKMFHDIPAHLIDMESFWKHSIRCGLFAQVLASHRIGLSEERLFVGGLLHDIGRLVMLRKVPVHYTEAIGLARKEKLPMFRAEQKHLHCDHAEVGRLLAKEWRLSPALEQMIGGHHSPAMDRYPTEACLVHIADLLAHACAEEPGLTTHLPPLQVKAWETVGLSPSILAPTITQVDRQFREIVRLFLGEVEELENGDQAEEPSA